MERVEKKIAIKNDTTKKLLTIEFGKGHNRTRKRVMYGDCGIEKAMKEMTAYQSKLRDEFMLSFP